MGILTASQPRVIRSFARPRPAVKPTRITPKPDAPFAAGLASLTVIRSIATPGVEGSWVEVTHRADYSDQTEPQEMCPYQVREHRDGSQVYVKGYYDASAATCHLEDLAEILAKHASVASQTRAWSAGPKPLRRLANRVDHGADDEAWWAANRFAMPPICGGSPEPECGVSGAWSMPGELEAWLDDACPDPTPELSDDANGAFGTFGCDPE